MNNTETKILIIVLATVIPITAIILTTYILCRRARQKRSLFRRGITPINDEEIESWRTDRSDEKTPIIEECLPNTASSRPPSSPQHHRHQNSSVSTVRKPPSVIVYHNHQPCLSDELSPRSLHHKRSIDVPDTPVLARAPNARLGLTDEAVQGDDAFISPLKRQPSRLAKLPKHGRSRSSRSSFSMGTTRDQWPRSGYGSVDFPSTPRRSGESIYARANRSLDLRRHKRMHSVVHPQRQSFDDEVYYGGLSPRPLIRRSDIGRAIG